MHVHKKASGQYLTIPDRKLAVAETLSVPLHAVKYASQNLFMVNGSRYLVVTEDEADDLIREGIVLLNMEHNMGLDIEEQLMWIVERGRETVLAADEIEIPADEFFIYLTN